MQDVIFAIVAEGHVLEFDLPLLNLGISLAGLHRLILVFIHDLEDPLPGHDSVSKEGQAVHHVIQRVEEVLNVVGKSIDQTRRHEDPVQGVAKPDQAGRQGQGVKQAGKRRKQQRVGLDQLEAGPHLLLVGLLKVSSDPLFLAELLDDRHPRNCLFQLGVDQGVSGPELVVGLGIQAVVQPDDQNDHRDEAKDNQGRGLIG